MDVANLLFDSKPPHHTRRAQPANVEAQPPVNQTTMEYNSQTIWKNLADVNRPAQATPLQFSATSPQRGPPPRHVTFELLLTEGTQHRARLPLRVGIYPHDSTESIISTVKNFFGLYDGYGVSFENKYGDVLIPLYQNFEDKMMVYVRVVEEMASQDGTPRHSMSPRRARLGPPIEMGPPHAGLSISRPSSRTALIRSPSPQNSIGRRSQSVKARSRGSIKSRAGSTHGSLAELNPDFHGDETDSDGGNASVTSSRRDRMDIIANADISVDNIVEGGRRKRARFEASELPLFVPSQIPVTTSVSSVSPQRRFDGQTGASPFQFNNQQTFTYNQPLPSPQSHPQSDFSYMGQAYGYSGAGNMQVNRIGHRVRTSYPPPRYAPNGFNNGILPTPDPTINSVISDEDVALQLMRLGDASNFSSHARISNSTIDETLSGRAELGSSAEASDEGSDEDLQAGAAVYTDDSEEEYEDQRDGSFKGSDGLEVDEAGRPAKRAKISKDAKHGSMVSKSLKMPKARPSSHSKSKIKTEGGFKVPISPTSVPAQQRKGSTASLNMHHAQFAADEEDLSSKPRCQRCRKSKKGCDRQRPCGRCRDAGIGIEGCVSEDEGNGRKGRYGRHMGVPIKKADGTISPPEQVHMPVPAGCMAAPGFIPDKNGKKRKRS